MTIDDGLTNPDAVLMPAVMADIIVRWLEQTYTNAEERVLALDIARLLVQAPRPHRVTVSGFSSRFTTFDDVPSQSLHNSGMQGLVFAQPDSLQTPDK